MYKLIVLAAIVTLTGCYGSLGNRQFVDLGSYNSGAGTMGGFESLNSDPGYNCPSSENVSPYFNAPLDGTMDFTVCRSSEDAFAYKIKNGSTDGSSRVCVFPAQVFSETELYLKLDVAQGILHHCVYATHEDTSNPKTYYDFLDVTDTFPGANFNAMFIIEQKNLSEFLGCMNTPSPVYSTCPNFSFGMIQ